VSWLEAEEYCRVLSRRSGRRVRLPTEVEWEYAARAGTTTSFWFGATGEDFSARANLADRSLSSLYEATAGLVVLQPLPAILERDDGAIATATVGSYAGNPWGLHDVHGNAAEWTATAVGVGERSGRVVRGGSFHDRPTRARSARRWWYPPWQKVHDVGFRIVVDAQ
jgi:formylglycine-generating enzyme required for sulfatase activity